MSLSDDLRFGRVTGRLGLCILRRANVVQIGLTARSGHVALQGCHAEIVDTGSTAHTSAGRVTLGTVIAPGVGTLVGAIAKKHRRHITLRLTDVTGASISVDTVNVGDAEWFAAEFNRRYAKVDT